MVAAVSITIPDVLGGPPDDAERFLMLVAEMRPQSRIALDLCAVTWIRPHGAVILLGACRFLAQLTGQSVHLTSLRDGVHANLRRIDFFARAAETAYTSDSFEETNELLRSKSSFNLLELIPIAALLDRVDRRLVFGDGDLVGEQRDHLVDRHGYHLLSNDLVIL